MKHELRRMERRHVEADTPLLMLPIVRTGTRKELEEYARTIGLAKQLRDRNILGGRYYDPYNGDSYFIT